MMKQYFDDEADEGDDFEELSDSKLKVKDICKFKILKQLFFIELE
jgi:hypothetical protein